MGYVIFLLSVVYQQYLLLPFPTVCGMPLFYLVWYIKRIYHLSSLTGWGMFVFVLFSMVYQQYILLNFPTVWSMLLFYCVVYQKYLTLTYPYWVGYASLLLVLVYKYHLPTLTGWGMPLFYWFWYKYHLPPLLGGVCLFSTGSGI